MAGVGGFPGERQERGGWLCEVLPGCGSCSCGERWEAGLDSQVDCGPSGPHSSSELALGLDAAQTVCHVGVLAGRCRQVAGREGR